MIKAKVHGRCIQLTPTEITLINESGISQHPRSPNITPTTPLTSAAPLKIGDIVEISEAGIHILTSQQSQKTALSFQERILHPRRLKAMRTRAQVETSTRAFFNQRAFHEVRTPLLVRSPGMEAHIDPFQLCTHQYLPSSPEFAMKKLLVGGLEKIFQVCPAFRNEPFSKQHRPEFTLLEFYRAYSNYEVIMQDFENLVEQLALQLFTKASIVYQGQNISLKTPWPRLKINDLFQQHLQIDLLQENTADKLAARAQALGIQTHGDSWDETYFRLWLDFVEPRLAKDQAVFVTHFPASQAALARLEGQHWAKRFEAYIGGLELCNGFDELTDAKEQRRRFTEELQLRKKLYGEENPIDENFLLALEEGMPPAGGVAVGLDRLIMLLADEPDIEYCFWLNPEPAT